MKIADLKTRLRRNRPMTTVTMRIPEDVLADLKRIAPLLGHSGYQPLIRAYIGAGLREDLERMERDPFGRFVAELKEQGVPAERIEAAMRKATA